MSLSDHEYHLIQKYLGDTLTGSDQSLFDEKLKNAAFQKELVFQAKLIDALQEIDNNLVKEQIETAKNNPPKNKSPFLKYLFIFLALLAFVSIMFFAFKGFTETSVDHEIVASFDAPFPPFEFQRGEDNQMEGEFKTGMLAYANENYEKALEALLKNQSQDDLIQLYIANCHLQLKQYKKGNKLLEHLCKSKKPNIQQNAEWYLALSKLGSENLKDGKNLLFKITKTEGHLFQGKATSLLRRLD